MGKLSSRISPSISVALRSDARSRSMNLPNSPRNAAGGGAGAAVLATPATMSIAAISSRLRARIRPPPKLGHVYPLRSSGAILARSL